MQEAAGHFESGEAKILKAALNLKDQNITTIMKKIDDVFMLELGTVINRQTLGEIYKKGYSRIPVFQGERSNIVGILMAKDLILLNPDRDHYALEHLS